MKEFKDLIRDDCKVYLIEKFFVGDIECKTYRIIDANGESLEIINVKNEKKEVVVC